MTEHGALDSVTTILFDIDGTLVRGANAHHACMARAASEHGLTLRFEHDDERVSVNGHAVTGWLDAQVFRFCALPHECSDAELAAIMSRYAAAYEALPEPLGALVPGASEVLAELAARSMNLRLTTGNAHRIARRKLASMGIDDYFDFDPSLGFGDVHADRTAMVAAALGADVPPHHAVVVGDTPYDMEAAMAVGAIGVGVRTGSADEQTLARAGASHVITSVADLQHLLGHERSR